MVETIPDCMRTLFFVPFVCVVACGGTFEIDTKEQTCAEDIFSWSGGLTRHVLEEAERVRSTTTPQVTNALKSLRL